MSNVTLSDRAKRCIVWFIGICTVLSLSAICVHSCKRSIQCNIDAKRNRVIIHYVKPSSTHSVEKKSK